jgi:hypothetical protein
MMAVAVEEVDRWLESLYVAADGATLRAEDRRKARQVAAMLDEIARAVARHSRRRPIVLVDAAAGKTYLGLLAAKLVLEPSARDARVVAIERDETRVAASRRALGRLDTRIDVRFVAADVADAAAWPKEPSIVVALHACGAAADAIIDRAVAEGARTLLLVPCCTGRAVAAAVRAEGEADRLGIPFHAPVRRRFVQAMVDAERTVRLESAGYETEVVEFVGATITPHNLLWRSRLVKEPVRMASGGRRSRTAVR